MKTMLDETLFKLGTTKAGCQLIKGVPCYDILANPDYQASFQYVPVDVPKRALMIQDNDQDETNDAVQCDVVRIALNLAMQSEADSRKLSFQKEKLIELYVKP